jgi:septum formation protein
MPPASPKDRVPPPLILASGSAARIAMLRAARVPFETMPAPVDEAAVKAAMLGEGASPRDVADALAELKARRVAARAPGALVVGADQVLSCDGRLYDKPCDPAEARDQLVALRGRTHELHAAAVVYEDARPVWRRVGRAQLTMRPFTDAFLDGYVAAQGAALCETVGGYRIEAGGAQLFARVQGDLFIIMGLPLLELLAFLRTRGVVPE